MNRLDWFSRAVFLILGGWLVAALALAGAADQPKSTPDEPRAKVGKCTSPAGTVLAREAAGKAWRALKAQEEVFSSDLLLSLPGNQGEVDLKDGGVGLQLRGTLPESAGFSVLASGVVLHATPGADADFTLDRGRVVVVNRKEREPARVRVRFHGQTWDLNLEDKGTEVALSLFARWTPGTLFRPQPEAGEGPGVAVTLVVLKGQADLKVGGTQHSLRAPPGPAAFRWNSVLGADQGPARRDKLPAWVEAVPPAAAKAAVARQRQELARKAAAGVLAEEFKRPDATDRLLAVYGAAALDDLPLLVSALGDAKHPDTTAAAVPVLQHWIGRGARQDSRLYDFLVQDQKYPPAQAETVLQLLHDFSADDLNRPETYESLIAYLRHRQPAVRVLAAWYLRRLVPAGQKIAYNPGGSEAELTKAYEEWKALIPSGKLPPRGRPEGK